MAEQQGAGQTKWQTVQIGAGQTESQEIPIPAAQLSMPRGHVRNAAGMKLLGEKGVRFEVQDTGTGSKIVLQQPATENLTFRYKQGDPDEAEDGDDDDEGDAA